MEEKKKIVIFDFDGVFVDDFDFHKTHIEKFLGTKISDEEFYAIHSGNIYKNDGRGLELEGFHVQDYCNIIYKQMAQLPLVDGMKDVVTFIGQFAQLFVVSSGCEKNIRAFFAQKAISIKEWSIYGVETNPSKEKKLLRILSETKKSSDEVIFITDTLGDILEANTVGVASIAATWGFQKKETLAQGAPFGFANTPSDIISLVEAYFNGL